MLAWQLPLLLCLDILQLFVFTLPVLADVEAPLELEMGLLVVIDEAGHGVVMAAREHAGGSLLLLDCAKRC